MNVVYSDTIKEILTHKFGCLDISNGIENDIQTPGKNTSFFWLPIYGVCLTRVGNAIGK